MEEAEGREGKKRRGVALQLYAVGEPEESAELGGVGVDLRGGRGGEGRVGCVCEGVASAARRGTQGQCLRLGRRRASEKEAATTSPRSSSPTAPRADTRQSTPRQAAGRTAPRETRSGGGPAPTRRGPARRRSAGRCSRRGPAPRHSRASRAAARRRDAGPRPCRGRVSGAEAGSQADGASGRAQKTKEMGDGERSRKCLRATRARRRGRRCCPPPQARSRSCRIPARSCLSRHQEIARSLTLCRPRAAAARSTRDKTARPLMRASSAPGSCGCQLAKTGETASFVIRCVFFLRKPSFSSKKAPV